jgi:hypothetical protein
MKNIKLFAIAIFSGLFITVNVGQSSLFSQERQDRQDRQERHDRQDRQGAMQDQPGTFQATQLPQAVQEKLQDDYEDWRVSEASQASDPEEGSFYMIKLDNLEDNESKIVMIDGEGDVIEEEDILIFEQRQGVQSEGEQHRDEPRRDERQRDRQFTPVVLEQDRREESSARTDSLPQPVQASLLNEFSDWSPTIAHLAADPEDGTYYYKIKMHNASQGETQVVRITSQGEVIDKESISPLGDIDDADRGRRNDDNDDGLF